MRSFAGNIAVFVILLACLFQLQGCDAGDQDESERDKELIKEKIKVEGAADLVWKYKSAHDKCVRDKQRSNVDLEACQAEKALKIDKYEKELRTLTEENAQLKSEKEALAEKLQAVSAESQKRQDRIKALETKETEAGATATGAMSAMNKKDEELKTCKQDLLTCKTELTECNEEEAEKEVIFQKNKELLKRCKEKQADMEADAPLLAKMNDKLVAAAKETENAQATVNEVAEKEKQAEQRKLARIQEKEKKKGIEYRRAHRQCGR